MSKTIGILFFSPTSSTKKISIAIAQGMGENNPLLFDMTNPRIREKIQRNPSHVTTQVDHLIVGSPVHSGKLPYQVIQCLESIRGNHITCSAVVVYGNRDFGISLCDMVALLSSNGFQVTSAGAFIAQHTYSDIVPVAINRPDQSDLKEANRFGLMSEAAKKTLKVSDIPLQEDRSSKSDKYGALQPVFLEDNCTQCGDCAEACPLGLIDGNNGKYLNTIAQKQCIGCLACVHACPEDARTLKTNPLVKLVVRRILKTARKERKEPLLIVH